MLDAFLSRIRSFAGRNAIGHVSNEGDVLATANIRDSKIRVTAEIGLHLDEIGSARNQGVNIFAGFRGIGDDQRRLKKRRIPIEIGSSKENSRSLRLAVFYFFSQLAQGFKIAAHITDSGDSIREEKRKNKFAAASWFSGAGEVDVHVDEARD